MLNIGGHHEGAVFGHSIDRRCALGTRACTYRFLNLLIIIKVLVRVSPMIRIARPGDISATINLIVMHVFRPLVLPMSQNHGTIFTNLSDLFALFLLLLYGHDSILICPDWFTHVNFGSLG